MKNNIKFLGIFLFLTFLFISNVNAQSAKEFEPKINTNNLIYPISELGSCKNKVDCAKFCTKSENMVSCVNYAEKNNLLTGEDLRISKAVAKRVAEGTTPGSCKNEEECKNFCSSKVDNIKECVAFADELKLIPENELTEAKKILKALEEGAQMPGSCKTKSECENYCSAVDHIDECLAFAEVSEIISKEELSEAKKVASFLKDGKTPGKCKTKGECENYCSKNENFNECISFAESAGLVSKEDAEMAKKAGGVGPGGCKSKESCEEYCNKEENIDACTNFALEKGLVSDEERELMTSGIDQMIKALDSLPEEMKQKVESCLQSSIGEEKYNKIINKTTKPTKEIGEKIQSCFDKLSKPGIGEMKGGIPNSDDIQKMVPSGVPKEYQEQIQEQIQKQMENGQLPEDDFKTGGFSSGGVAPAPMKEIEAGPDCLSFSSIPDVQYCQMVPEGPARETCIKCKS